MNEPIKKVDGWEEEVRNMVYEVWTSHSSSKYMVELVGKLLQAQREKDKERLLEGVEKIPVGGVILPPEYVSREDIKQLINKIYG
jgi:hypothetical protein